MKTKLDSNPLELLTVLFLSFLLQCLEVLEDHEDDVLNLLMKEKVSDDIDIELCTVAANYCDDVLPEDNYVLEDHEEL